MTSEHWMMLFATLVFVMNMIMFGFVERLYKRMRLDEENRKLNDVLKEILKHETDMPHSVIDTIGKPFGVRDDN